MNYIKKFDGSKCPIDLENPLVMMKGRDFGRNYERGSLVYPIGDSGEKPGRHSSKGWMTISTLNTDTANFCGVEVGKTAVPLRELLEVSGKFLDIAYNGNKFTIGGKKIDQETAINEMLDYYATMQIPEEVRNSSGLSRIISSEKTQHERGIIFEKLENVAAALIMYDMGFTSSSTATRDRLYSDMWASKHPNSGVDDPSVFRNSPEGQLISLDELMNCVKGEVVGGIVQGVLKSGGKYSKHFDYDGMGTAFFKTSVEVEKIDNKYILDLSAAYVGDKPEEELAKTLERERGLVNVGSSHELTALAQDWAGLDVNKSMKDGTLTLEQISALTRISAGELKSHDGFMVEMGGMPINLSLGIGQDGNHRAEVSRAKGNQLFMKTEGTGKPYLSFSLRPAKKDRIVNPEEKERITKLRDGLSELVQKNLS
ncbi:MAG: hypothetical protein AABW50_03610 [Nanoarchaeota archaeon]